MIIRVISFWVNLCWVLGTHQHVFLLFHKSFLLIIHFWILPVWKTLAIYVSSFWSCLKTPMGNNLLLEDKCWQTWLGWCTNTLFQVFYTDQFWRKLLNFSIFWHLYRIMSRMWHTFNVLPPCGYPSVIFPLTHLTVITMILKTSVAPRGMVAAWPCSYLLVSIYGCLRGKVYRSHQKPL